MSEGLYGSLGVSASGMTATRLQMDVIAENLANANSTSGANGQPYQRKEVVLQQQTPTFADALQSANASGGQGDGVEVAGVVNDPTPGQKVYDPGHPDADAQGYVTMPNVNPVTEMVDLITASRSYEANVQAMNAGKQMFTKTLDILK
ncbi:MAG TPA: flagellar basal body rod protein FlgC [Gaiellaceae bacterium]